MRLLLIIFGLLASVVCLGQQSVTTTYTHELHGIIRDPNGRAMSGLRILRDGEGYPLGATGPNGEFAIKLAAGDHVLTIEPESLYGFRAFIKIVENGPNPDDVLFTVDPDKACCTSVTGIPFPKPISLPKPAFPPAARAVRAMGQVIVAVKIGPDGKVTSAKALGGHPLLRRAAEAAAASATFNAAEAAEREARLFYVFIDDETIKEGVTVYTNPYRVEIVAVTVIDY